MAANGVLDFQSTNKLIFRGANANVVIDTQNLSLGVGHQGEGAIPCPLHISGNGQTVTGGIIRAELDDPGGAPYESNAFTLKMGSYSHSIRMELNTLRLNAYGDAGRYGAMQFVVGDGAETGNGQVAAMTISSGGDVGIGTTIPDGPLHISKSAPYNGDTGPGILFTRYSNTHGGCIWNESNNNIDGLYFNAFLATAASTAYGATPKMVINSNGRVGVGIINPRPTFEVFNSGLGTGDRNDTGKIFAVQSDSTSWTSGHALAGINIKSAVGTGGRFLQCNTGFGSTGASTLDAQFILYEQGTGTAEIAWNGGGADYAEYFEWSDGNPDDEDRVGMTVKLNGDKIELVSETDDTNSIIGAISGNPGFVGDNAGLKWTGKYLRDDFGRKLMEDYEVYAWKDEKGDDQIHDIKQPIPEDLNIPEDRIVKTARRRVLNPIFDPDVAYVPREERKEWSTVGLVGKLRIRTDQPIHPNWILLRNISDSVGEWLIK
jgi:hypothetical protein